MIDRAARNEVGKAIRAYLNDEISASALDDALFAVTTKDRTLDAVREMLWFLYDDLRDHRVVLDKAAWDYVQRLLLILEADAVITEGPESTATWRGWLAAGAGLTCGAALLAALSLAPAPLAAAILLGAAALAYATSARPEMAPREAALFPFASITELAAVRRRVPAFQKQAYRVAIATRKVRPPAVDCLMLLAFYSWAAIPILCARLCHGLLIPPATDYKAGIQLVDSRPPAAPDMI